MKALNYKIVFQKMNMANLITVVELDEVIAERREDIMHLLYIGKRFLIKLLFRFLQVRC